MRKNNKLVLILVTASLVWFSKLSMAVEVATDISGNSVATTNFNKANADKDNSGQQTRLPNNTDVISNLDYLVQPGDILVVSVWKEKDLQNEVIVRPDGGFSFPLIGEVQAQDRSIIQLRKEITERISKYIPDADVMVAAKQLQGNKVYVIGKVNRPGEFPMNRTLDVMQALAIAGGATQFANVDDIIVIRRGKNDQQVFKFDYNEVEKGENLQQNILLTSGDVVVVP